MGKIDSEKLDEIKKYYYTDNLCTREIAEKFGVSIDAVIYFMRKNNLKRRSFSQINKLRFDNKPISFKKRPVDSDYLKELNIAGIMLYWAEGSKSGNKHTVDLANSDPDMISVFLNFLRKIYKIDEKIIKMADIIREYFGKTMIINNWNTGGLLHYRGYRPENYNNTAKYSAHFFGKAIDFNIKGIDDNEVRETILKNRNTFYYITRMEDASLTPAWIHIDVYPTDDLKNIIVFK